MCFFIVKKTHSLFQVNAEKQHKRKNRFFGWFSTAIFEKNEDMYTEKDKERITISVQKKLLTKIDEASKKAGFTRAKYSNRVLSEMHNDADCDVKNALDAVISLSKNPHNWMRIPREFRTYDVYRALVSVCPADAVSILELVPPEWWSLINKESIIKQAAKNIKILYNLPCEYRNDALTCICETAKKAWEENDKNSAKGKRKNPQIEIF